MFKVGDVVEHVDGHSIGIVTNPDLGRMVANFVEMKVIHTTADWNPDLHRWKYEDLTAYEYGVGDIVEFEDQKYFVAAIAIHNDSEMLHLEKDGTIKVRRGSRAVKLVTSISWVNKHGTVSVNMEGDLVIERLTKIAQKSTDNAGKIVEIKHMSNNAIKKEMYTIGYMIKHGKKKVTIARGQHPDYGGVDKVKILKDDILTLTYL